MRNLLVALLLLLTLKGVSQNPTYVTITKFYNQADLTPPDVQYPNPNGINYYVNADDGNNLNTGTGLLSAWEDLTKVNTALSDGTIKPGDSILFKRGQKWQGRLTPLVSGTSVKHITFGAYGGAGEDPVITAFITPTTWTLYSGNIYRTTLPTETIQTLNNVMLNGQQQRVGRYPNFNTTNEGFINYTSANGSTSSGGTINITAGAALPWNAVGAEIVIKVRNWVINKAPITAHVGTIGSSSNVLSYTQGQGGGYLGPNGFGFFIQRDLRTLDQLGEWYYDNSTNNLYMHFGSGSPAGNDVKVSVIDTILLVSGSRSYLDFNGLNFEGANMHCAYVSGGQNFTFKKCSFTKGGRVGLLNLLNSNVTVDSCNFVDIYNTGVLFRNTSGTALNWKILNCNARNIMMAAGMGFSGDATSSVGRTPFAISGGKVNTLAGKIICQYNHSVNCGYAAIEYTGSYVDISYNFMDSSALVMDDVAAIYTFEMLGKRLSSYAFASYSRLVKKNIVLNVLGNKNGTNQPDGKGRGIYHDNNANNVFVDSNFVYNSTLAGIYNNDIWEIKFRGNIVMNCGIGWQVNRFKGTDTIYNVEFKNNQFYPYSSSFTDQAIDSPYLRTIQQALQRSIIMDSSKYFTAVPNPIFVFKTNNNGSSYVESNNPFSYLTALGKETHAIPTFTSTDNLIFRYNEAKIARVIGLPGTCVDQYGNTYSGGSVTLQPYEVKVFKVLSAP